MWLYWTFILCPVKDKKYMIVVLVRASQEMLGVVDHYEQDDDDGVIKVSFPTNMPRGKSPPLQSLLAWLHLQVMYKWRVPEVPIYYIFLKLRSTKSGLTTLVVLSWQQPSSRMSDLCLTQFSQLLLELLVSLSQQLNGVTLRLFNLQPVFSPVSLLLERLVQHTGKINNH